MIVRILGEGQWDVPDEHLPELTLLDDQLEHAADAGDEEAFAAALSLLQSTVRSLGTPLPAERIVPSRLVLPYTGATIDDVRTLLTDSGRRLA